MRNIEIIQKEFVDSIRASFRQKVKFIGLIGSGNVTEDFVDSISDLDFIIVVDHVDLPLLENLSTICYEMSKKHDITMDARAYSLEELQISSTFPIEALNPWVITAFRKNLLRTLHKEDFFEIPGILNTHQGLLQSSAHFIHKIRRFLGSGNLSVRGHEKTPSLLELKKNVISSTFCILKFYLASKGVFVTSQSDMINTLERMNINTEIVHKLRRIKQGKEEIDMLTVKRTYEFCEEMYKSLTIDFIHQNYIRSFPRQHDNLKTAELAELQGI